MGLSTSARKRVIPIAVRAFERLEAVVDALVDGECACDGECFPTFWEVTAVRLCRVVDQRNFGTGMKLFEKTNFLAYAYAYAAAA